MTMEVSQSVILEEVRGGEGGDKKKRGELKTRDFIFFSLF